MSTTLSDITARVQDLYTRYPYPTPGAIRGSAVACSMDYNRFVLWPGRTDVTGLRVLDAGCGTGQSAVVMAHEHPEIKVVGIDLSQTSLQHARALARQYGVGDNLELHCLPIEAVGELGQTFDYIIASGVIHHLEEPLRGLRALADVLAPTGGLFLMVYATYGRTGVYMLQDALRQLAADAGYAERVQLARRVVRGLPSGHPFGASAWEDVHWDGDAGIVDLLLHVRDRSYTVPQLYELLEESGLSLTRFMDPLMYEPSTHVADPELADHFSSLDARTRATVAELLSGSIRKHELYATRSSYVPMRPRPSGAVLLALRPIRSPLFAWGQLESLEDGRLRLKQQALSGMYTRSFDLDRWMVTLLEACDGKRSVLEIFLLPEVQTAVPGENTDDKLDNFGGLMQAYAEQEVLLCFY